MCIQIFSCAVQEKVYKNIYLFEKTTCKNVGSDISACLAAFRPITRDISGVITRSVDTCHGRHGWRDKIPETQTIRAVPSFRRGIRAEKYWLLEATEA